MQVSGIRFDLNRSRSGFCFPGTASMFKYPGICRMAGGGNGYPTAMEVISGARRDIADGKLFDAFLNLEYYTGDHFHQGRIAEATQLFVEGKRIFEEVNSPTEFMWGLRIAEHGFRLGRTEEARSLFDSAMSFTEVITSVHGRDQVRFAASMIMKDLDRVDEALDIAEKMEQISSRFGAVVAITDSLIKSGAAAKAKEVILNHGAVTARMIDKQHLSPVQTKVARLIMLAEKLMKIGENKEAEKIVDEGIESLGYHSDWWVGRNQYELELLEKSAIVLLGVGKREKAINLLTDGWFNQDYLDSLTPEQAEVKRIELIEHHHFSQKFGKALKAQRQ